MSPELLTCSKNSRVNFQIVLKCPLGFVDKKFYFDSRQSFWDEKEKTYKYQFN